MRPPGAASVAVVRPAAIQAVSGTADARLTALEGQRASDHQVMNALADAIVMVQAEVRHQGSAMQAITQSGLDLRQALATARAELASGVTHARDAAQDAAMAQMAVTVEAKFAQMDALTASLTAAIQTVGMREQYVEQVVEKVAAGGVDAFKQMDAKISRVASIARAVDGTEVIPRGQNAVTFTAAMDSDMKRIRDEFAALPAQLAGQIASLVQPVVADMTEMRVRVLGHDESIGALESNADRLEVAIAEAAGLRQSPPGIAVTCGTCGPTAQSSPWGHSPPVVPGAPAQTGSSGDGDQLGAMRAVIGGNQLCHCIHVKELVERVDRLEAATRPAAATFRPDPWSREGHGV